MESVKILASVKNMWFVLKISKFEERNKCEQSLKATKAYHKYRKA